MLSVGSHATPPLTDATSLRFAVDRTALELKCVCLGTHRGQPVGIVGRCTRLNRRRSMAACGNTRGAVSGWIDVLVSGLWPAHGAAWTRRRTCLPVPRVPVSAGCALTGVTGSLLPAMPLPRRRCRRLLGCDLNCRCLLPVPSCPGRRGRAVRLSRRGRRCLSRRHALRRPCLWRRPCLVTGQNAWVRAPITRGALEGRRRSEVSESGSRPAASTTVSNRRW